MYYIHIIEHMRIRDDYTYYETLNVNKYIYKYQELKEIYH